VSIFAVDSEFEFQRYKKLSNLPPSAKFILYILKNKGILNRKTIEYETMLPKRTIGAALTLLLEKALILKVPYEEMNQRSHVKYGKRADSRETYYELKI
jgi:hypothetical protein